MNASNSAGKEGVPEFASLGQEHPRALGLILALVGELGRSGQCGILNPAVGYVLRQSGMSTCAITGELDFPSLPILKHMDAGQHTWTLVRDIFLAHGFADPWSFASPELDIHGKQMPL